MLKKFSWMKTDMKKARFSIDLTLKAGLRIIVFICIIALPCCGVDPDNNTFYTYIQSDPARLDPFYSTDVVSGRILANLCNGLFKIDRYGKLQKDLVEAYTFNGILLNAELKKNIFFSSGLPVTADDVIYSFRRIKDSEKPTSPRKGIFGNINKITATGSRKITIRLKSPSSAFLYLLTTPNCYIISKTAHSDHGEITGSGPFAVSEWERDYRITLRRNSYSSGQTSLDYIVYRIIPDDLTARFEFLNGTLDYFELPYITRLETDSELHYIDAEELSVHYIAMNTCRYPFTDRSFRQAINMAVNRDEIMKCLFDDRFRKAAGPVPPVGEYHSRAKGITFEPDKARKIICGMNPGIKEITLLIKSDHQVSLISQMLQHYLQKAGLKVTVRELEWSALKAATLKGKFDMAYFTWHADYPEPENFLYPLFYSGNAGAGGNRTFYSNRHVDSMLIEAGRTIDDKKRFALYQKIERIIIDDAPWLFLWYGDRRIALSKRVKKFIPFPVYNGMKGDEIELTTHSK